MNIVSFDGDLVIAFRGKYCEEDIDECQTQPCKNGGQCRDMENGYTCSCQGTNSQSDYKNTFSVADPDLSDVFGWIMVRIRLCNPDPDPTSL